MQARHRISNACVPYLPRGVRLHDDRVRGIRVLLAPERAMQLDPVGDAILSELDGTRSLAEVILALCTRYAAPAEQIEGDVQDFIAGLVDRRMVFLACGGKQHEQEAAHG
ncbi:pyrroloquinoline quinone biosynthesis peptide chaperone PqqD [Paracoccus yeei]|uniref:Pyrroloquinoline quinone biosynthesis peptide chaperone PqqD n=1 Tax=Paracoccus yeei TaxID=147645 RepID=A0A1V0GRJ6_9RHOB|nr:pyrroloquinoline quinone biosynthesis peptide chaperone PqqD [Paracoccus yeei]ARC36476.1 pyrroloquinoline quinone biosynthesis peptide chaperone PqqD [Paracoccus yeei]ATQ55106.1 pyrroloquinoline quinone biosynthesis peptide chaperone PqqD [Paracoccus yeei]MBY0134601.1 pyrroloquinoline quinone biosynthesis peptide chaperone PqqD [Paracoccus yeei]OWJ98353.1 pyrroloquinoline quinone biosynthesis protein PqqD [Paracoccus yeei]QEU10331.1 pyrroloquinoline quinone biosynthesis peptide chaperone Pq